MIIEGYFIKYRIFAYCKYKCYNGGGNMNSMIQEYDYLCKEILSHKIVLAYILQETIDGFHHYSLQEIVENYLHDQFSQDIHTQYLSGDKEDIFQGSIRFDLLFSSYDPLGSSGILFDVEAQTKLPSTYHLENRMQYYASRMI